MMKLRVLSTQAAAVVAARLRLYNRSGIQRKMIIPVRFLLLFMTGLLTGVFGRDSSDCQIQTLLFNLGNGRLTWKQ